MGHYPVHVRFSDVDVYGHVNNVKYFEYFMEARILFTARLWSGLTEEGPPARMVTARTDVDYKVPILFRPEPYDAWSWLTRVGDRSMVIESEICDGDRLLARARVAMVFVDPATSRPKRHRPRSASACSPRRDWPQARSAEGPAGSGSSKLLTMNCAACLT